MSGKKPKNMQQALTIIGNLKTWIRSTSEHMNICTYDILGKEVCKYCQCKRKPPTHPTP